MPSLGSALERERNSFNAVRLAAAAAVVVSHSFALIHGEITGEPLSDLTPYTLGQHAVNVFFVLSGVMVSRSWALSPGLRRFALARLLRIYPGLVACGLVTALGLGALGTTTPLAAYLKDGDTLLYPLAVAVQFNQAGLDGVFTAGTKPGAVNASLWTVKYEVAAYALFAAAAWAGWAGRRTFAAAAALAMALFVVGVDLTGLGESQPGLLPPGRFFLSFALGLLAYALRDRLALGWGWVAGLGLLALAARGTVLDKPAFILLTGYAALVVGARTMPHLSAWTGRTDLSYGLYLYAWPVQQLLLHHWPTLDVAAHAALSLILSLACAALSWPLVERPALALKSHLGGRSRPVPHRDVLVVGGGPVRAPGAA